MFSNSIFYGVVVRMVWIYVAGVAAYMRLIDGSLQLFKETLSILYVKYGS